MAGQAGPTASNLLHRTLREEPELAIRGEGIMLTLGEGRQINGCRQWVRLGLKRTVGWP